MRLWDWAARQLVRDEALRVGNPYRAALPTRGEFPRHIALTQSWPLQSMIPYNTSTTGSGVNIQLDWSFAYSSYRPARMRTPDRILGAVDEWFHRHSRYTGNPSFPWIWWRHPLGSLWWWAWRPLCNYWDRRLG